MSRSATYPVAAKATHRAWRMPTGDQAANAGRDWWAKGGAGQKSGTIEAGNRPVSHSQNFSTMERNSRVATKSKGTHGGQRPGAGRPKKSAQPVLSASPALRTGDPREFLLALMADESAELRLRIDAAKALMPFLYERKREAGKKGQAAEKAKATGAGRFAPKAPPARVVPLKP